VHLEGGDHTARQALAQYIARAPLSLQKLTCDRAGGKVLSHTSYNPYFKQNTSLWSAPDIISHLIPEPWMAQGRRSRGWRKPTTFIPRAAAAHASHRACRPPGVAPVLRAADVPSGRSHTAHDGVAHRLSLSMGRADREGVRGRSADPAPSQGRGFSLPAHDRQTPAGTRSDHAELKHSQSPGPAHRYLSSR